MSTEVNITLRASLEDVPREVVEFLETLELKLEHELQALHVTITNISKARSHKDYGHCLVDMESVRKGLYRIDSRVEDGMSIISAYQQHLSSHSALPREEEDSSVDSESEDIVANYD